MPSSTPPLSQPRPQPKPLMPARAADPVLGKVFDPWNSSSTGHQRAENRLSGSTGWRDSRNSKLMVQFTSGGSGGRRVSDTVGEGSKDWNPTSKLLVRPETLFRAKNSVKSMLANPGSMKSSYASFSSAPAGDVRGQRRQQKHGETAEDRLMAERKAEDEEKEALRSLPRPIFAGVVVYVNGSTHPHISDHKLKHLLAEHGGRMSMHLGRRQVTHVILGRPSSHGVGCGGGLAGGKLQREIQKVGGCSIKFVGVEWVLESLKAGKRLPEARFSNLKIASKGQESVYGLYSKPVSASPSEADPPPSGQRQ